MSHVCWGASVNNATSPIWTTVFGGDWTTVAVRWFDEDGFAHVNNAAFLTYAEEGRDRLLTSLLGDESVWDVVIVRIEVDYRAEVTHRDAAVDVTCMSSRLAAPACARPRR
jgi:acyl-CoA thioesterase FadM